MPPFFDDVKGKPEADLKEKQTVFAYCPCGVDLSEKTKFCAGCGRNVEDIIKKAREETFKCSCGESLSGNSKFCASCGSKVDASRGEATLSMCKCSCGETIAPEKKFCGTKVRKKIG